MKDIGLSNLIWSVFVAILILSDPIVPERELIEPWMAIILIMTNVFAYATICRLEKRKRSR